MAKIEVTGGRPLHGEVTASGAKNAVLPILAATLLTRKSSVVRNVPHLQDVTTTNELLGAMGADIEIDERMQVVIDRSAPGQTDWRCNALPSAAAL